MVEHQEDRVVHRVDDHERGLKVDEPEKPHEVELEFWIIQQRLFVDECDYGRRPYHEQR